MPCSECGYDLSPGQADCPRCLYRAHMRQRPSSPAAAAPDLVEPVSTPTPPVSEAAPPRRRGRWVVAAVCVVVVCGLLAPSLLRVRHQAQAADAQVAQAGAVFARADGPCRRGVELPCRDSISALVALRDHSDAAFLLGDFRVARYLQARPGGGALEERWQQDGLSADELMALADEARRQHRLVFRSFWMYANAKQGHIAVPTLAINNDPFPFGVR